MKLGEGHVDLVGYLCVADSAYVIKGHEILKMGGFLYSGHRDNGINWKMSHFFYLMYCIYRIRAMKTNETWQVSICAYLLKSLSNFNIIDLLEITYLKAHVEF